MALVEAPQCEPTRSEQRGGVFLDRLRLGARGQFHLAERIAALGGNSDPARDHVIDTGNVGAATAHQDLFRLLAAAAWLLVQIVQAVTAAERSEIALAATFA